MTVVADVDLGIRDDGPLDVITAAGVLVGTPAAVRVGQRATGNGVVSASSAGRRASCGSSCELTAGSRGADVAGCGGSTTSSTSPCASRSMLTCAVTGAYPLAVSR
jgi:hypothetical protein